MDKSTQGVGSNSSFAQQLWRRHTRLTTHGSHSRLMRRIYGMQGDYVPLANAIQRRWLPTAAPPYQSRVTLPYRQPTAHASIRPWATNRVQRTTDRVPSVPRVVIPRKSGASTAPQSVQSLQRAPAVPATDSPRRSSHVETNLPVVTATPLPYPLQRQPQQTTTAAVTSAASVQSLPSVAQSGQGVARPTIPIRPALASQATTDLGRITLRRQAIPSSTGQMPYRVTVPSIQQVEMDQMSQVRPTVPAVVVQRQTAPQTDSGQIAKGEGSTSLQIDSAPTTSEDITIAQRLEAPVSRRTTAGATSPLPLAYPSSEPSWISTETSNPPTLGMAIVQRHMAPIQRSGSTIMRADNSAVSGVSMNIPSARQATTASDSAGVSARALPLARIIMPMTTWSGDTGQPLLRQAFSSQPLRPQVRLPQTGSPQVAVQYPTLPLIGPSTSARVSVVQRQMEAQLGPATMGATRNGMPQAPMQESMAASTDATGATTSEPMQKSADELVDKLWRKLMRRLAVEGERRGGRQWP